jgi:ferrous-iron efflux pump FieF
MSSGKTRIASIAMIYSLSLLCIKLMLAVITKSLSILSDCLDSLSDIILLLILKRIVMKSSEPVDSQHTYGKGKYESLGSIIQFVIITILYAMVIYNAIQTIISLEVEKVENSVFATIMFVCFAATNLIFGTILRMRGKKLDSISVQLQGLNYSSDGIRSIVVIFAMIFSLAGFSLADPIFAIGIAVFVILLSLRSIRGSVENLVERNPFTPEEMILLYEEVPNVIPDIMAVQSIRVKKVGDNIFVTMDLLMDGNNTLQHCHEQMEKIEEFIRTLFHDKNFEFSLHPHP